MLVRVRPLPSAIVVRSYALAAPLAFQSKAAQVSGRQSLWVPSRSYVRADVSIPPVMVYFLLVLRGAPTS